MRLTLATRTGARAQLASDLKSVLSSKGDSIKASAVVGIQGVPVSPTPPAVGDTLVFDGTAYVPGPAATSGQYRQFVWEIDGAGDWDFLSVDDGTGQLVPVTVLVDLE